MEKVGKENTDIKGNRLKVAVNMFEIMGMIGDQQQQKKNLHRETRKGRKTE